MQNFFNKKDFTKFPTFVFSPYPNLANLLVDDRQLGKKNPEFFSLRYYYCLLLVGIWGPAFCVPFFFVRLVAYPIAAFWAFFFFFSPLFPPPFPSLGPHLKFHSKKKNSGLCKNKVIGCTVRRLCE
jgi:hypothetical protein